MKIREIYDMIRSRSEENRVMSDEQRRVLVIWLNGHFNSMEGLNGYSTREMEEDVLGRTNIAFEHYQDHELLDEIKEYAEDDEEEHDHNMIEVYCDVIAELALLKEEA